MGKTSSCPQETEASIFWLLDYAPENGLMLSTEVLLTLFLLPGAVVYVFARSFMKAQVT